MNGGTRLYWHRENHSDYLSDHTIRSLSFAARGVWATAKALLYWSMEPRGYFVCQGVALELDDILALVVDQVSRVGPKNQKRRNSRGVLPAFQEVLDGRLLVQSDEGIWFAPSIVRELEQSERNRVSGLVRGEQLRASRSPVAEQIAEPRADQNETNHHTTAERKHRSAAGRDEQKARLVCAEFDLGEVYLARVLELIQKKPDRVSTVLELLSNECSAAGSEYQRFIAFEQAMKRAN